MSDLGSPLRAGQKYPASRLNRMEDAIREMAPSGVGEDVGVAWGGTGRTFASPPVGLSDDGGFWAILSGPISPTSPATYYFSGDAPTTSPLDPYGWEQYGIYQGDSVAQAHEANDLAGLAGRRVWMRKERDTYRFVFRHAGSSPTCPWPIASSITLSARWWNTVGNYSSCNNRDRVTITQCPYPNGASWPLTWAAVDTDVTAQWGFDTLFPTIIPANTYYSAAPVQMAAWTEIQFGPTTVFLRNRTTATVTCVDTQTNVTITTQSEYLNPATGRWKLGSGAIIASFGGTTATLVAGIGKTMSATLAPQSFTGGFVNDSPSHDRLDLTLTWS